MRIGLAVGVDSARVASPAPLRVLAGRGGELLQEGSADEVWRLTAEGSELAAVGSDGRGAVRRPAVVLTPSTSAAPIVVNGQSYAGSAEAFVVPGHGLVVVNRVPLEQYLLGVVPAEMGRRSRQEIDALRAQAVAARTYAVRSMGSRDSLGFDMFASVEDQVYQGTSVGRPDVTEAVHSTAGEILVYGGEPIRAYYHSTGGGRTAAVHEVWPDRPDAPYLRSVSDRRPGGGDYCDISPRYRWKVEWSPGELDRWVRPALAAYFGLDSSAVGRIRSIRVLGRTRSGRVDRLRIRTDGGSYEVEKDDVRRVLRPPGGGILGSSAFEVTSGSPDPVISVAGRGFGHGVGMCQWGAIGRARAGQGYRKILATYYPGTRLEKAY